MADPTAATAIQRQDSRRWWDESGEGILIGMVSFFGVFVKEFGKGFESVLKAVVKAGVSKLLYLSNWF